MRVEALSRSSLLVVALAACEGSNPADAPCPDGSTPDGACAAPCGSDADCLLSEVCVDGYCAGLPVPRPLIERFEGPAAVVVGASAELSFEVAFADTVRFGPEGQVSAELAPSAGAITVGPLEAQTTYVLIAESPTGSVEARHTVGVECEPTEDPVRILSFAVDRARVPAGTEVELSWTVEHATGPIRLSAGSQALVTDGGLTGTARYVVEASIAFALSAPGQPSPALATLTVVVEDADPPALALFEAVPNGSASPLARTRGVLLRWSGQNGAAMELLEGASSLVQLSAKPNRGAWLVAPPVGQTRYSAVLSQGTVEARAEATVQVAEAGVAPEIRSFAGSEEVLDRVGATEVSLGWDVVPANAQVTLRWGQNVESGLGAIDRYDARIRSERSVVFELEARTAAGVDTARWTVWAPAYERESNDARRNAQDLNDVAVQGVLASSMVYRDVDWFEVDATGGARVEVRFTGCDDGLRAVLFDANDQEVARGTASNGSCPQLDLQNPTGEVAVRLDGTAVDLYSDYEMIFEVVPPECGDGAVASTEACDDGNRVGGDGCSSACTIEPGFDYAVEEIMATEPAPATDTLLLHPYAAGGDAQDAGRGVVDLGTWTFPFFGEAHAGFEVHADGFVGFFPVASPSTSSPVGPGGPNAFIAPFLWDLRLGSQGALRAGVSDGGAVVELSGLELSTDASSQLDATVELRPTGEIILRYGQLSASADAILVAGIESPRGARFVAVPGCEEGCTPSQLSGRSFRFTPR